MDIFEQLIKEQELENSIKELTQNAALEWEIVKTLKCQVEDTENR